MGKTKTVTINEMALRVLRLARESAKDALFCSLGDILLFGNKDRLKMDSDIEDIYLDYRVKKLKKCLAPASGWRHCFTSMIELLEDCVSQYHVFVENQKIIEKEHSNQEEVDKEEFKSFLEFVRARFKSTEKMLRKYLDLPSVMGEGSIKDFCYQTASLILCTASSSYKLYSVGMEPLNLLVIDEAAQLKESESTIPLQLPGLRHAILVGDECQLPATVISNVSSEAGFGISLFERLSSLGHSKHLLNMQYRMHPSISSFPNSKFYSNLIMDAPYVMKKSYERHYLSEPMFGPYSFINVVGGKEEVDDVGRSRRNWVEVAVVVKIVQKLYKAWEGYKKKLSIGVISPYAAQVVAIKDRIEQKYDDLEGFTAKVKSVDGFQGGEADVIWHCLWILGNEKTLASSESVWEAIVRDARHRQCFFDADLDKDLAKAIIDVEKELHQMDDLFNKDSILFKSAKWKVCFSDDLRKSFGKLTSPCSKKLVMNLLLKLSSGWRPKKKNVDSVCKSSAQILKQFKVWDILPLEEIPKLVKRLDGVFAMYTDDYIDHCKQKCFEGYLEVPKSWVTSFDIVQFKKLDNHVHGNESSGGTVDGRSYVENSKVSESLLLMKFYSLSSGVVSHILSDRDGKELDLPFEETDQELEIISSPRSTFILGRSGTGKTTVLTMKLFQREQHHHIASEGIYADETSTSTDVSQRNDLGDCVVEIKDSVLRQLFVTVSPKLCYAIKQRVSGLKSDFEAPARYLACAFPGVADHCVLRLWLERKILPESLLRQYMDDIGVSNDDASAGFFLPRPSRAERAVDDPIRDMEGMLVDEYVSGRVPTLQKGNRMENIFSFPWSKDSPIVLGPRFKDAFQDPNSYLAIEPIFEVLKRGKMVSALYESCKMVSALYRPFKSKVTEQGLCYFGSFGVSGAIPSMFAALRNLQTVWASNNELTGSIPEFIGNWSKLKSLRFQGNSFGGSIPTTFSNLTLMEDLLLQLFLGNNKLTGTLPAQKSCTKEYISPEYGCGYEFQMQYGSIGWAVGATLGYAQAAQNKQVIASIGDGSFQVTAQDVSTMLRCEQRTIIFLIEPRNFCFLVDAFIVC
ncbi:unnamed protein product [Camellia sinensis]